jgi:hypothetical protein
MKLKKIEIQVPFFRFFFLLFLSHSHTKNSFVDNDYVYVFFCGDVAYSPAEKKTGGISVLISFETSR